MKERPQGVWAGAVAIVVALATMLAGAQSGHVQFVFTSDQHYGITRGAFRGASNVDAHVVNQALVASINGLPNLTFPQDGGVETGRKVGAVDFVAVGGDVANREEVAGSATIQRAAVSWAQFKADYIDGLTLLDRAGHRAPLYVVPGNHEASNTVGFYRKMAPPVDKTAMVEIYNRMMAPAVPRTVTTFDYARDKVLASRDVGGVHFMYLSIWPDSTVRVWMEQDLQRVSASTPVIVFTHDEPDVEAKHFINPNGRHDVNARDRFENLLADQFADGRTIDAPSTIEQKAFEDFLARHRNLTAYFHGNSNWNQFYDWAGPRHTAALHTFRVDSPMKGAISSKDETKLSFQIATIDMATRTMTVRECLWNVDPRHPTTAVTWGASTTIQVAPGAEERSKF